MEEAKERALLTRRETCEYLRISSTTLWEEMRRGALRPVRLGPSGHKILFRMTEIQAYLVSRLDPVVEVVA